MTPRDHHHRSQRTQHNKPFKGGSSVSTKKRKLISHELKSKSNIQISKSDRLNSTRLLRQRKQSLWRQQHNLESRDGSSTSTSGYRKRLLPPKLSVLISFHSSVSSYEVKRHICAELGAATASKEEHAFQASSDRGFEDENAMQVDEVALPKMLSNQRDEKDYLKPNCVGTFALPSYAQHPSLGKSQRISILDAPRDVRAALDMAKCADVIVCLFNHASLKNPAFDELGYQLLSALKLQGLPSVIGVSYGMENSSNKEMQENNKFSRRYFLSEFGNTERFVSLENLGEIKQLLRLIGNVTPSTISWREHRGYMLAEQWQYDEERQQLAISGHMRGTGFALQYPLHITGLGDYAMQSIKFFENAAPRDSRNPVDVLIESNAETTEKLMADWSNLRPYDPLNAEQTWPTLAEMEENARATNTNNPYTDDTHEKINPCGEPDAENYGEDFQGNDSLDEDIGNDDPSQKRIQVRDEMEIRSKEDLMFPDEVDTPGDIMAKQRFQKYRGLKSFRSSSWDPYESLPVEYSRIFDFESFHNTMKACKVIYKEACDTLLESAMMKAGNVSYCTLYISNFPSSLLGEVQASCPLIVSSVLPYERKVSALNFLVKRCSDFVDPIESKAVVELQCGFRRFFARPIYSEYNLKDASGKAKYERFLHSSESTMMTVYGQCISAPSSVLMFKDDSTGKNHLVAWGTLHGCDANRLIIKRIVLTGYPFRVNKKKAVIRFMFFNPDDIRWFMPVELYTKKGLRGHIKSSLGTHGYMKCVFNGFLTQDDTVCMFLYKRTFPKWYPPSWNGHADCDAMTHPPVLTDLPPSD
ncbi:putative ribosome biogenesis protein [Cardiosporidium cionae]|uniref:Ribosome biogenesis protein n=1 Tax=Cardiosporidium cionae TaxID=476202 RepID=A0ABQ7JD53_9APIC|nr:putative ribosome biogenesis protein [Cardiosporidium cionae]|eukprot:KAF8821947.1 putative ribosome biogenesis protein [Cardiosporidium cionae]